MSRQRNINQFVLTTPFSSRVALQVQVRSRLCSINSIPLNDLPRARATLNLRSPSDDRRRSVAAGAVQVARVDRAPGDQSAVDDWFDLMMLRDAASHDGTS